MAKHIKGWITKILLEDMDFEKYTDFVINMPLLFVVQNFRYLDAKGDKFIDFMHGKLSTQKNIKPNIVDFENHLATIFTEVRLKKYIEIRSLDTCEWDCHCGGPAFYTGLLYGNLNEAYDIINKWKISGVLNAYIDSPKKGLKTILNNLKLDYTDEIFDNKLYTNRVTLKTKIPTSMPKEYNHAEYRSWQINQLYINNNNIHNICLSDKEKKLITENTIIKQLYTFDKNLH